MLHHNTTFQWNPLSAAIFRCDTISKVLRSHTRTLLNANLRFNATRTTINLGINFEDSKVARLIFFVATQMHRSMLRVLEMLHYADIALR